MASVAVVNQRTQTENFGRLTPPIMARIVYNLDLRSLVNLCLTCWICANHIKNNSFLWGLLLQRDFTQMDLPKDNKSYETLYKTQQFIVKEFLKKSREEFKVAPNRSKKLLKEVKGFELFHLPQVLSNQHHDFQNFVLASLASEHFQELHFAEVREVAFMMTDSSLQREVLETTNNADIERFNSEVAKRTPMWIHPAERKDYSLGDLALAQIQKKDLLAAINTAMMMDDPYKRSIVLKFIAQIYFNAMNLTKALEIVQKNIPDNKVRSETLKEFSSACVKMGILDTAESIAKLIPNIEEKNMALKSIAKAYLHQENLDSSKRIALSISDETLRDSIYRMILSAYVDVGNMAEAKEVVNLISNRHIKLLVLKLIIDKYTKAGNTQEAEKVIKMRAELLTSKQ